ncbi:hypothetical protein LTR50_005428 [Elasticomyces elasticus]|nr:hypothetical protein LTR50_005428 [Elasticomyces elasticus]
MSASRDASANQALEVDFDFVDNDSTFSDGAPSDLTSLSSSVTAYVYENGRRYHAYKEGKYYAPNDEEEMDREDMKHHWFKLLLLQSVPKEQAMDKEKAVTQNESVSKDEIASKGETASRIETGGATTTPDKKALLPGIRQGLHLAPIGDNPTRILDLGTGTGIWVMEMGDAYPSAQVIGTDLSPIQPKWVAPNVTFEIDDMDDEWVYGANTFDLVHVRFMGTAVKDWSLLCKKAFYALKPGGYLEIADLTNPPACDDDTIPANSQVMKFFEFLTDGCLKVGRDLHMCRKWQPVIADAGFVGLTEKVYKLPVGGWPKDRRMKEAGVFEMETLREGLPAIGMGFFTRVLKWTPEEVHVFFAGVRKELDDKGIHFWLPMHVIYAQKPKTMDI